MFSFPCWFNQILDEARLFMRNYIHPMVPFELGVRRRTNLELSTAIMVDDDNYGSQIGPR